MLVALHSLLLDLAVGRLCLSLLPPGWPGEHGRRELGATLCASLLLGILARSVAPWLWLWGLVLLVRLALLPGALRPRHEQARGPAVLWELAFVSAVLVHFLSLPYTHPDPTGSALLLGVLWLVAGWRTWRRRADRRARSLAVAGVLSPLVVILL